MAQKVRKIVSPLASALKAARKRQAKLGRKHIRHRVHSVHRHRRDRGVSWYTIEDQLRVFQAKTIPELREKLRRMFDDDKLWELIEAHHQANEQARKLMEEASKRARKTASL